MRENSRGYPGIWDILRNLRQTSEAAIVDDTHRKFLAHHSPFTVFMGEVNDGRSADVCIELQNYRRSEPTKQNPSQPSRSGVHEHSVHGKYNHQLLVLGVQLIKTILLMAVLTTRSLDGLNST